MSACGGGDSDAPEVEAVPSQTSAAPVPDVAAETAAETTTTQEPDVATETASEPVPETDAGGSPFADDLLTDDEFPIDGFTRGEVTSLSGDDATEAADGGLTDLLDGQDVSQECLDALEVTELQDETSGEGASVEFAGPQGDIFPTTVQLAVGTIDSGSPLEALSSVSAECDTFTIEEGGESMSMTFAPLTDLEGTEISMSVQGISLEFIVGGKSNDELAVLAFSTGLEEADVVKIVEAQLEKVENAG